MSAAAMAWITGRDTGISSKAIWSHMVTGAVQEYGHPHDNDDIGRCFRLLTLVPEWRARIGEMAQYSPEWAALVSQWDELWEAYLLAPRSPALYQRMRTLLDAARVCMDCGVVAPSAWTVYPDEGRRVRCYKCAEASRREGKSTVRIGNVSVSSGGAA